MVKKIIIGVVSFIVLILVIGTVFFVNSLKSVGIDEEVTFEIKAGTPALTVIKNLKDNNLIKNELTTKIYAYSKSKLSYQAGVYTLNKNMSVNAILDKLIKGDVIDNSISITFVEGKRVVDYAKTIASALNADEKEVLNIMSDKEYLQELIDNNWFITDEILNSKIYYPLEGYLYPNTYKFKEDATIKDVINKLISTMKTTLDPYKDKIESSSMTVHEYLTMASLVEQEAATKEDRDNVAGVFYNRLNRGMTLGSDVTAYYGVKKTYTDMLSDLDLINCNAYNTRSNCVHGLPVGPISSVAQTSISAAISPNNNDYLYFVADTSKKVYFSRTGEEQQQVINRLKSEGKWGE